VPTPVQDLVAAVDDLHDLLSFIERFNDPTRRVGIAEFVRRQRGFLPDLPVLSEPGTGHVPFGEGRRALGELSMQLHLLTDTRRLVLPVAADGLELAPILFVELDQAALDWSCQVLDLMQIADQPDGDLRVVAALVAYARPAEIGRLLSVARRLSGLLQVRWADDALRLAKRLSQRSEDTPSRPHLLLSPIERATYDRTARALLAGWHNGDASMARRYGHP
jgi:hypothetical protein